MYRILEKNKIKLQNCIEKCFPGCFISFVIGFSDYFTTEKDYKFDKIGFQVIISVLVHIKEQTFSFPAITYKL